MEWSGTAWAFFPHYILDGFVVSKWVPQYTTEQFVVLLRYNRYCEPVPNTYWPKHLGLNIYYQFENVSVQESNLWSPAPENLTLHTRPLPHILDSLPPPFIHTQAANSNQRHSPHYIAGVFQHLECWTKEVCVLIRKHGACVLTQTYLCHFTNTIFPKY